MGRLNISQFARLAKTSRPAIYKAIATGRLKKERDGTIDTSNKLNADYLRKHNPKSLKQRKPQEQKSKQETSKNSKSKKPSGRKKTERTPAKSKKSKHRKAKPGKKSKDPKPKSTDIPDDENLPDGGTPNRSAAELQKVLAQIRQIHVRTDKERMELVDRKLVRKVLAQLSSIDVNELLTLGGNIAPEVAALCGKDKPAIIVKITKLIEQRCYRVLKHRQRLINDFIEAMKAEALDESDLAK